MDQDRIKGGLPPEYYTKRDIEPWEVIKAWKLDYFLGNVVKYIFRGDSKPGETILTSLYKARNCLREAMNNLESEIETVEIQMRSIEEINTILDDSCCPADPCPKPIDPNVMNLVDAINLGAEDAELFKLADRIDTSFSLPRDPRSKIFEAGKEALRNAPTLGGGTQEISLDEDLEEQRSIQSKEAIRRGMWLEGLQNMYEWDSFDLEGLDELSENIKEYADGKGFDRDRYNIPQQLMLIVSEVSEAMEVYRSMGPNWFGELEGVELESHFGEELADAVIRILDTCAVLAVPIRWHIKNKMGKNKARPFKHGKKL